MAAPFAVARLPPDHSHTRGSVFAFVHLSLACRGVPGAERVLHWGEDRTKTLQGRRTGHA
ncbi:hypothetical protein [Streptomyces gulbargensis]|uniref:hypothetical protein n=1 Tax=Streptomyces gulbargensis TaxID=364901 RepID=UPI0031E9D4B2